MAGDAQLYRVLWYHRADPHRYVLRLLPRLDLLDDRGRSIALPVPAQRLLAFLALEVGPVARLCAAGSLWPDRPEARAHGSLRSAMWRCGRLAPGAVVAIGSSIGLGPGVVTDVNALTSIGRQLSRADAARREDLTCGDAPALARLFEQELLTDWWEDWVEPSRERWRQVRLHGLEALARRLAEVGDIGGALDCGLAAVRAEPLRESSHRLVIELHLLEGNRSEAVREYDTYCSLLARELGVTPDPTLSQLFRRGVHRNEQRQPLLGAR